MKTRYFEGSKNANSGKLNKVTRGTIEMENQNTSTQTGQKANGGDFQSQPLQNRGQQGSHAQEHTEGVVARTIEEQTAKLPSDTFLWAAVGAMGASAVMQFTGHKDKSRFFGQWVAPLLLFGVYNKLVKVAGSDRLHH
jgi:hypothetical protein